jgi:hypothetical protein
MKIEICNLGVVNRASIDLKPLTVFIGENDTGKTWTAYALSAIFGQHGVEKYLKALSNGKTQQTYLPLEQAIEQLLDEGNAQIDLVQFANDYAQAYINDVARLAPSWMPAFLATRRISFEHLQVHVDLANAKATFLEKITAAAVENKLSVGSVRHNALLNALKESGEPILYFYSEGDAFKKLPARAVKYFVATQLFQTLHSAFYSGVCVFPTERTSFIGAQRGEEISLEEAAKNTVQSESERGKTRLAVPVTGLLDMIATTATIDFVDRQEQINANPKILNYVKLAEFLEKDILVGNVFFETVGLQKELIFQPLDNPKKFEMPLVSSMVKELAPLVLYLRYLVEPNHWLIIDEPEMNLHPAVQVEFIEFLGMLVNAGLHVLITTHSPYIVDHLANLMTAAQNEDKEKFKKLFYLERTDAFIGENSVSVYQFDEGTTRNVVNEKVVIDWHTFGEVSSELSSIYSQLSLT